MDKHTDSTIKRKGKNYASYGVSIDTHVFVLIPTVEIMADGDGVLILLEFLCFNAGIMFYSKKLR